MKLKLGWITVTDLEKAQAFFSKLGLSVQTKDSGHGWLELSGHTDEFVLGVWEHGKALPLAGNEGSNAILCFYVDDIEKTKGELEAKGIRFTSAIYTLPTHIKIADFTDPDGNMFQLVQDPH